MIINIVIELKIIVSELYAYNSKLKEYLSFNLKCESKKLKSKYGDYDLRTATITLFSCGNVYPKFLYIVAVHELAHHIQMINTGASNHGIEFYQIFKELIHISINKNIISTLDVREYGMYMDTYDRNKVVKMLDDYIEKNVKQTISHSVIHITQAGVWQSLLISRNYKWNPLENTWDFICYSTERLYKEKEFLRKYFYEKDIYIGDIKWLPQKVMEVSGDIKKIYYELSSYGFLLQRRDKGWVYIKDISESTEEQEKKIINYINSLKKEYAIRHDVFIVMISSVNKR